MPTESDPQRSTAPLETDRPTEQLPAHDPATHRTRIPVIDRFAATVYVAPDGDDTQDGSAGHPLATLVKARDRVRALKAKGVAGPIGVILKPGEYPVRETLILSEADSGSDASPIVYKAERMGSVTLYGGRRLSGFRRVTDPAILARLPPEARDQVVVCDLNALGITDFGKLAVRGFGQPPSPPTIELYFNGQPLTLARWPNEGFVPIQKLVQPGDRQQGLPSVIQYEGDRPARWTKARDAWLFGYFKYLWADAALPVGSIDPQAKTITTGQAYQYGQGAGMSTEQGIIYYVFNLLEEIDRPGEWYLDRQAGQLYLYPPTPVDQATVEIGMLSVPMISAARLRQVRFEGIQFDMGRFNAIQFKDCDDCRVAGCTVKRFAGNGIMIHGGMRSGIVGCDIHIIGRRATEVLGGDRKTLTPARHFVENCQIHAFGRIDRTYTPGVQLEGVGHRVAHNLFYDAPSSVMRIEGNDHVIENNRVYDAVQESDDQGAMELYGNPTYRGVVFRNNYFCRIGKTGPEIAVHGQAGIRFDDAISGMVVYGNIFVRSANGHFGAIQINSGRDNVIERNWFYDCKQGVSGGWNPQNSVWRMMRSGGQPEDFYVDSLHLSRYPLLKSMLDEPAINHLWRNVFQGCGRDLTGNRVHWDLIGNLLEGEGADGQGAVRRMRDPLRPDPALCDAIGFRPIPPEEIGLYPDPFRASWPPGRVE